METPIFDAVRDWLPDKAIAWDLGQRPVRDWCSDARALAPDTAIVAACEPRSYRQLSGAWHDQDTARSLDESLHRLETERAAIPVNPAPVIEFVCIAITLTDLPQAGCGTVASWPGGNVVATGGIVSPPRDRLTARKKVLLAARRACVYLLGAPPGGNQLEAPPVQEPPVAGERWMS